MKLTRRTSAFRLSAPLLLALGAALPGLAASCATGDGVDVDYASSGADTGGTQVGAGGAGGAGAGSGGAGGGAMCVAEEACDGIDNTCDGQVDEGCTCLTGSTQPCYTGLPAETADVGACKKGVQTCDAAGAWGACEGEVVPAVEACNAVDDDCDGQADEDLGTVTCGVGACQATVPSCEDGVEPTCEAGQPTLEVCDGVDNNCNQLVDELYPEKDDACTTGQPGVCSPGITACVNGALTCTPNAMPSAEKCDGLDNDCDGAVDDLPGTGNACSTGFPGVCSEGVTACVGGVIDCVSTQMQSPEVCDGLDNDCDGQSDEGNPGGGGSCMTGDPGACGVGTLACVGGALTCNANGSGGPEQCNGIDDNCDGQVDEGNPGAGPCNTGQPGACGVGSGTCNGGTLQCSQTVMPSSEVCGNGVDEDCNGVADNGCAPPCAHDVCVTGAALQNGCSPCVSTVCAADSYCCTTSWDAQCTAEAFGMCNANCANSCSHSVCATGSALTSGCNPCAAAVCANDFYCCFFDWDSQCVGEAETICGVNCP